MRRNVYAWFLCYAGMATSSVTTIPQHKMDIQTIDNSMPGNGDGKIESIVKFIIYTYLTLNHHQ